MQRRSSLSRWLLVPPVLCAAACASSAPSAESTPAPAAAPELAVDPPTPAGPDRIVLAHVDGVALSLGDALASFEETHGGHSVLMRGEPAVRELAGRLIERQLFLAEARALGLDRDQDVREASEERRQLLAEQRFWKREVDEKVSVSDAEVEAFYAKTDVALSLSIIETAEREACEALRRRVEAGESLAEIAVGESIHPSRSSGGLVPIVKRGELPPELDAAAFALTEEKSLTPVLPSEHGFAFARLEQRMENTERPPREVMLPQIRGALEDRARKQVRADVEQRLRAEAGVEVDAQASALGRVLDESGDRNITIARSAGESLTLGELQDHLDLDKLRSAPQDVASEAVAALVMEWCDRKASRQAARQAGLFDDPEILGQAAEYEKEALLAVLYQRYVYANVSPTDEQLRAWYEEHADTSFTRPPEARVAYLTVATLAEAEAALARLRGGEEFADVARALSSDARSSVHGGRIGWVRPGDLLEPVEAAVMSAPADSIQGPIETPEGVFVVHVMERHDPARIPFEEAREGARRGLESELRQKAYADWVRRLRERADVAVDEQGVQAAVAWLEQEAQRREALP